jgi:hypothetical protein
LTLKAVLFNPGGSLFRGLREVFIAPNLEKQNFSLVELADVPAPHGAAFGQATGLLLKFHESRAPEPPCVVALARSSFPKLDRGFYVCDLLGLDVNDEKGQRVGRIVDFSDVAPAFGGAVNLTVESPSGQRFEFPAAWIAEELKMSANSGLAQLTVPGIREWMEET